MLSLCDLWKDETAPSHTTEPQDTLDERAVREALRLIGNAGGKIDYHDLSDHELEWHHTTGDTLLTLRTRGLAEPVDHDGNTWKLTQDGRSAYNALRDFADDERRFSPVPV